jgi:hypothetical protein
MSLYLLPIGFTLSMMLRIYLLVIFSQSTSLEDQFSPKRSALVVAKRHRFQQAWSNHWFIETPKHIMHMTTQLKPHSPKALPALGPPVT